jgi:hypothetical protein
MIGASGATCGHAAGNVVGAYDTTRHALIILLALLQRSPQAIAKIKDEQRGVRTCVHCMQETGRAHVSVCCAAAAQSTRNTSNCHNQVRAVCGGYVCSACTTGEELYQHMVSITAEQHP